MSRPEMKHFLSIALFLLTATLGIDAQAQWRVADSYNQWGEKNEGEPIAVSQPARSVNGMGKRVYLQVNEIYLGCLSSVRMADKTPINQFLASDRNGFLSIPMKVNGKEEMGNGFVGVDEPRDFANLASGSKDYIPADIYGNFSESAQIARYEQIVKWLWRGTFKIILSTREYGRLIYEFDMTGSRIAILKACPDLF